MKTSSIASEYVAKSSTKIKKAQELYEELDALPGAKLIKIEVNHASKYLAFQFQDDSKLELSLYFSPHDQVPYQTHLKVI